MIGRSPGRMRLTRQSAMACHLLDVACIQSHAAAVSVFSCSRSKYDLFGVWNNSRVARYKPAGRCEDLDVRKEKGGEASPYRRGSDLGVARYPDDDCRLCLWFRLCGMESRWFGVYQGRLEINGS
jgi:hypothetical protein